VSYLKTKTILGEDLKPVIILRDLEDLEELARRWKQEIWETDLAYYILTPNYIWKVFKEKMCETVEESLPLKVKQYPLKTSTDSISYEGKWMYDVPVTC